MSNPLLIAAGNEEHQQAADRGILGGGVPCNPAFWADVADHPCNLGRLWICRVWLPQRFPFIFRWANLHGLLISIRFEVTASCITGQLIPRCIFCSQTTLELWTLQELHHHPCLLTIASRWTFPSSFLHPNPELRSPGALSSRNAAAFLSAVSL